MINRWFIFLANRYIWPRKADKKNTTKVLSILGLAAGVITLIAVMSIMNGLQLGFINDILEIESYHIRIYNTDDEKAIATTLENNSAVLNFTTFYDTQTLLSGGISRLDPVMVRLINEKDFKQDKSLIKHLGIEEFQIDIDGAYKVVIGAELARVLHASIGETISLISLSGNNFASLRPDTIDFEITGIFQSGYYQFDRNMIFISDMHVSLFEQGRAREGSSAMQDPVPMKIGIQRGDGSSVQGDVGDKSCSDNGKIIGIKLKNRYRDIETIFEIKTNHPNAEIVSWREYNKSFFSALQMEKVIMLLLIVLIFVVIGVNIFNSTKRTVAEKLEDIAVLYAIGAPEKSVRKIFLFEGIIIGLISGFAGVVLGLLIIININEIFAIFGKVVTHLFRCVEFVASTAGLSQDFSFTLFPSDYFYLAEIPVKIVLVEVVTIFIFALLSAVLSAYFASKKISVDNPAEYLRYE
ncbi:MAG: ABC transporter permease [Spirochaetaceae bacterium]|nr:ABC transporter permease [Spirochaetaceae bacterium]